LIQEVTMSKTNVALAAACLALATASAAVQGPSYESRGYGGLLYVGPNFQQGGQWSPPFTDRARNGQKAPNATARPSVLTGLSAGGATMTT